MLTVEQVAGMDHSERVSMLDELACELLMRDKRCWAALGKELGMSDRTVSQWVSRQSIPDWILLLLSAWLEIRHLERRHAKIQEGFRVISES